MASSNVPWKSSAWRPAQYDRDPSTQTLTDVQRIQRFVGMVSPRTLPAQRRAFRIFRQGYLLYRRFRDRRKGKPDLMAGANQYGPY